MFKIVERVNGTDIVTNGYPTAAEAREALRTVFCSTKARMVRMSQAEVEEYEANLEGWSEYQAEMEAEASLGPEGRGRRLLAD